MTTRWEDPTQFPFVGLTIDMTPLGWPFARAGFEQSTKTKARIQVRMLPTICAARHFAQILQRLFVQVGVFVQDPITPTGEFDLEAQKQIASKVKRIQEIKSALIQELDKVSLLQVDLERPAA
jgi:hypothetical protein